MEENKNLIVKALSRGRKPWIFLSMYSQETHPVLFLQMTPLVAFSPVPSPLAHCPPTPRPVTPPPAGICRSASAAWSLLLSSTPQGRSMASLFRPLGSTWVTAMSTPYIMWYRWVSWMHLSVFSQIVQDIHYYQTIWNVDLKGHPSLIVF